MKRIIFVVLIIIVGSFKCFSKQSKLNVIERTDFSIHYDAANKENLKSYYEFPKLNRKYGFKITDKDLNEQIKKARYIDLPIVQIDSRKLSRIIIEGLNIGFLLNNIENRKLVVTTISEDIHDDYIERELLFEDEYVGTFCVLMLVPSVKKNKYPVVVGFHGHGSNSFDFWDNYMGIELVRQGFVVIIPFFRAMVNFRERKYDNILSRYLLQEGFTLMGIRVYESLLVLKYLKYNDMINNERIGALAHSGGSAAASLIVRLSNDIKAFVRDYRSNYLDFFVEVKQFGSIHCETIPALSYYRNTINNEETLAIPVLNVPYGFKEEKHKILEFFAKNL